MLATLRFSKESMMAYKKNNCVRINLFRGPEIERIDGFMYNYVTNLIKIMQNNNIVRAETSILSAKRLN
jgi:hypothetical protein